MLKISGTATAEEQRVFLRLEGQVRGPWVEELRRACEHILGENGHHGNRLVLDLAEVSFIDADGVTLFRELIARRVLVTKCSPFVAEQLKEVADVADAPTASNGVRPMDIAAHAHDGVQSMRGDAVDEKALLAALRAGHEWAFETMIRVFGGRLLAVARRFTRNDEDARDVVQSAYLSAFRGLNEFEGACQLSTWLHRIVVTTALMQLRSRRRKPEDSIDVLLPAFHQDGHHVEQFSEWSAPADQLLERKETRATVRACVERLPENYRAVLMLRDIEELSTQEVAEMLTMTPTAVKVRLHRARQALSTLLRKEYARSTVTS